jgi:hypothetical protein
VYKDDTNTQQCCATRILPILLRHVLLAVIALLSLSSGLLSFLLDAVILIVAACIFFHIRTLHLDIIKVFIHQMMHK